MSQPADVEIPASVALPQIAAMIRDLDSRAQQASGSDAAMSIMESILGATDEEDVFRNAEAGTIASKDFLEIPFRLKYDGIAWHRSADRYIEAGQFPIYAMLTVTRVDTDERVVINAGGLSVTAVLFRLSQFEADASREEDAKPFSPYAADGGRPFQFVGRATQSGNTVVILKPVALGAAPKARSRARASA